MKQGFFGISPAAPEIRRSIPAALHYWVNGPMNDTAKMNGTANKSRRGFASMQPDKQREIARIGGANVPREKRSFTQNKALAAEAGRKGGRSVAPQARSFSSNRRLASDAGRKGGMAAQRNRRARQRG